MTIKKSKEISAQGIDKRNSLVYNMIGVINMSVLSMIENGLREVNKTRGNELELNAPVAENLLEIGSIFDYMLADPHKYSDACLTASEFSFCCDMEHRSASIHIFSDDFDIHPVEKCSSELIACLGKLDSVKVHYIDELNFEMILIAENVWTEREDN